MQPQQQPSDWQQPTTAQSSVPYAAVPSDDLETASGNTLPDSQSDDTVQDQSTDNEVILRWQSVEYVQHDRTALWYLGLFVVAVILFVVNILFIQSWTFGVLIPVMVLVLVAYVRRPPAAIDYLLSRKGLYVNDRLYAYDLFKSFGVTSQAGHHLALLVPRKRFSPAVTLYFPEDIGETLVDMLATRLPMKDLEPDIFDKILTRLKI